tara:strand:+ start:973 stop:1599 length:627 start_codon:yes stop_codon:yes gene_type:complete
MLLLNPKNNVLMKKYLFRGHDIYSVTVPHEKADIGQILTELSAHKKDFSYSHFIQKRWENIYLDPVLIPAVLPILSFAVSFAKTVYGQKLVIPHGLLGFGQNEFWFNIAKPGELTGVHNHKDKSTTSGVFYLEVPENSGNLFFKKGKSHELEFQSKIAEMVLFPSSLNHYVSENRSESERISLAFNCFAFPMIDNSVELGYEKSKYFV